MPSETERQRRFMGAELARKRAGKKTVTGMTEEQLRDFARKRKRTRKRQHNPDSASASDTIRSKDKHGYY